MLVTRLALAEARRRGVILLVVLAMLTLFAVLGISLVLYAESQAAESRIAREAEQRNPPDMDPEMALNLFLGQLLYDVPDDSTGVYSYLRGHSLARTMYGWNDGVLNDKPYNGAGRLNDGSAPASFTVAAAKNASNLVNFCWFPAGLNRDPERLGTRANANPDPTANARGAYVGCNVGYTYPDVQNMYLAAVKADGTVISPSYHRAWLWGNADMSNTSNANWTNPEGKYLTLRPRPFDMMRSPTDAPKFPYPDEPNGDVQNLTGGPGGNDSIWIDIGAPVMTAPDGRKFKMLVAPLILDLDSRVNLITAGNILGTGNSQVSNQSWGPYSVNLAKVLNNVSAPNEWQNVFTGTPFAAPATSPRIAGKYGPNGKPDGTAVASGAWPRGYAQVDFNEMQDTTSKGSPSFPMVFPNKTFLGGAITGAPPAQPWYAFPNFGSQDFGWNNGAMNANVDERTNHPLGFNLMRPTPGKDDRLFPASSMAALLRYGGTNADSLSSELLLLCPKNFASRRVANLVTTHSFDLDRPGILPYIYGPAAYQYDGTPGGYPKGPGLNFPPITSRGPPSSLPAPTEFDPNTWRSLLAQLGRIDLNRNLTDYPQPNATTLRFDTTALAQAQQAQADRQQFARDIFDRLRQVVGAADPSTSPTGSDLNALRWLAQLSVNIVDYIDSDDIMTPFAWNQPYGGTEVLYGTEVPRLVINEAYAQWDNNKADLATYPPAATATAATDYNVNVWVELHNPLLNMPGNNVTAGGTGFGTWADNGTAVLQNDLGPVYQVYLSDISNETAPSLLRDPANTKGDPDDPTKVAGALPAVAPPLMNWGPTGTETVAANTSPTATNYQTVLMSNGAFTQTPPPAGTPPMGSNTNGFYVVGPVTGTAANSVYPNPPPPGFDPGLPVTARSSNLTYVYPKASTNTPQPVVMLRRLANPYVQWDLNTNPYITVDYVQKLPYNDGRAVTGTAPPPAVTPMKGRYAWGRRQPYAAFNNNPAANPPPPPAVAQPWWLWQPQTPNPSLTTNPQNTFYRHNYEITGSTPTSSGTSQTLQINFDWLVHMDRQLASPMELLFVSAFKPHELTQQFVFQGPPDATSGTTPPRQPQGHLAHWTENNPAFSTRLYRFLEVAEVKSKAAGVASWGRSPGKININTVWDLEIFRALCDAQQPNSFWRSSGADTIPDQVFSQLVSSRTPGLTTLGANDSPFMGLGTGFASASSTDPLSPNARGIDNTILRPLTTGAAWDQQRLLEEPGYFSTPPTFAAGTAPPHPYQRYEMLTKIFNNITTRSNVFAVYLTVGFFEVLPPDPANGLPGGETFNPPKLGAEVGKAEGRNIRHRMFAIVDRSNLQLFAASLGAAVSPGPSQAISLASYTDPQTGVSYTAPSGTSVTDPRTTRTFALASGTALVVDADTDNEETVFVDAAGNTATFTKAHNAGAKVTIRGNPGPWPRYDPRLDGPVVPYFAIID